MKNLFVNAVVLALLLNLSASLSYADNQVWKIGHVRPIGSSVDKDIRGLTKEISEKTDGQINFEVYPASKLGDYSLVQERCSFGEVEMYVGPFGTTIDRRLALPAAPYLVKNWPEAKRVFAHDSLLMKKMAVFLEQQNIKLLGGWPVYFGGILTTKQPIELKIPEINKQVLLRVPPINSFRWTAKALGYTPYPITWVYARSGLESGMVEGVLGGGAEGYLGLSKWGKYYLAINDHFEHWLVYMNLELWQKLTAQQKSIIESSVRSMEDRRFQVAEAEEKHSLKELQSQGIDVIYFSKDEINNLSQQVRKDVWPLLERDLGVDLSELLETSLH